MIPMVATVYHIIISYQWKGNDSEGIELIFNAKENCAKFTNKWAHVFSANANFKTTKRCFFLFFCSTRCLMDRISTRSTICSLSCYHTLRWKKILPLVVNVNISTKEFDGYSMRLKWIDIFAPLISLNKYVKKLLS